MPKKKFKCSKCDRSFSMAGHLGRHMNATHGSGLAKATTKKVKRRAGKKAGPSAGLVSRLGLRNMTLEQLQDVIAAAREQGRRKIGELRAAFDWTGDSWSRSPANLGSKSSQNPRPSSSTTWLTRKSRSSKGLTERSPSWCCINSAWIRPRPKPSSTHSQFAGDLH